ncbi:zinc finger protein RFP-like isoform X1 [Pelodiscus sinensis]|uniref:zinc finger protein RFP-like isoform X1 n=1 Tax=Pelodiscus sinensis TaxID=13735 RepID=UPI003F6BEE4F
MASRATPGELQEEATCSLCLGYLMEPVTIACGHNFCRACLTGHCEERGAGGLTCPQCRAPFQKGQFKPNTQLNNIVQKLRQLGPGQGEGLCEGHQKRLKLFYEDYGAAVCLVCEKSRDHKSHRVVPMEEAAAQEDQFEAHVKMLREEREKLLGWKATGEEKSQEYLKQTRAAWQKIVAEFQQQRHFLEEQERLLLAQLQKLDEELVTHQTERGRKLAEQISCLSEQIGELEGKCQKPASESQQDIGSTLSRREEGQAQQPEEMAPDLEERVRDFSQQTAVLSKSLRAFRDTLPAALAAQRGYNPADVTLDPDTAHPNLVLWDDGKSVKWEHAEQPLPDTPERFDSWFCVLGREGFTAGRHCWEVELRNGEHWGVGVAKESMNRRGEFSRSPQGGIWAVWRYNERFLALTDPETPLQLTAPSRIRVCLDCDRGQVTFIDATAEAPIFTFPPGSLPGERIRPWLMVGWAVFPFKLHP